MHRSGCLLAVLDIVVRVDGRDGGSVSSVDRFKPREDLLLLSGYRGYLLECVD